MTMTINENNDVQVVEGQLRKATNSLILNHPFWAALRFRMAVNIGTGPGYVTPTAATDGITLWFNTEFCKELDREEFLGLLVHELGHVVFLHSLRRGVRDPKIWNIAGDYVINLAITKDGFKLPEGGLLDDQYDGMHTEEVYRRVYNKSGQGNPNKPCNGGEGGDQGDTASGDGEQCVWGEVLDAMGADGKALSPEVKKKLEQSMAVDIRQAMDTAKKQGNLPGHLRETFDKLLTPVMDWRDILSRFIADKFPSDYSWMNSSRRGLAMGRRFPGSGEEDTYGQISIGVDTSGSISTDEIQKMMSEVCHCLATYEAKGMEIELPVAYCDTRVHHVEVLSPGDTPYENAKGGGGGTCFAPVMEWVAGLPDKPEALLYLTDGYCDTFGVDPNVPVLWVLSGPGGNNSNFQPPFGEVMEMVDNEEN
jgi:predicted metal-dependent peptidase